MMALSGDSGPAFGAHAFIWAAEGAERVISGAAGAGLDFVEIPLLDPGALVMESFADVNEDLMGATALWRDVVGDPDALVRDGLAFLRAKGKEHGVLV